jgi:hypothetical protein
LFSVKNANFFANIFGENILKNHNIGPRLKRLVFQALNLYWLTTNLISISQSRLLRYPPLRQRLNIGDLIKWEEKDLPLNQASIFG